jgi:hypothetical protein
MRSSGLSVATIIRAAALAGCLAAPQAAQAVTITFGSGTDDPIGSTDSNLRAVAGPLETDFSDADWEAAVATLAGGGGVNPFVISPSGAWAPAIAGTAYVNTRLDGAFQGETGAYMYAFNVPIAVGVATLDLSYLIDNSLTGVRINDTDFVVPTGNFGAVTTLVDIDIADALAVGENRIFFRAADVGGPGGFDFLATIEYTEAVDDPDEPTGDVPAPGGLALLLAGLAGLGLRRRAARP